MIILPTTTHMLIFLSVILLVLYLVSIHINFRIEASFDLEAGEALLAFSVFNIVVFKTRGLIENRTLTEGDLTLFTRKKRRNMHIKVDRNSVSDTYKAIKKFNFTLFTNLDITKISLKLEYGNGDAFKTFAYLGMFRIIFYSLISKLKGGQIVEINEQFIPKFDMRSIKGEVLGIFRLSVADIIYGFLLSKYRKLKSKVKAPAAKTTQAAQASAAKQNTQAA